MKPNKKKKIAKINNNQKINNNKRMQLIHKKGRKFWNILEVNILGAVKFCKLM